jgi:hypothetical protein
MSETENDPSASTASFRAFAQRSDDDLTSAKRTSPSPGLIIAVVVAVLVVIGILLAVL